MLLVFPPDVKEYDFVIPTPNRKKFLNSHLKGRRFFGAYLTNLNFQYLLKAGQL